MTANDCPTGVPVAEWRTWLTERLARHLEVDAARIEPDVLLADYGLDSVRAVALVADIEQRSQQEFGADLVWEHPTVAALAEFLGRGASTPDR
ncbi:acyl carrier protein [Saccharopolyspora hirsuta]|uniref:Acyl carrier protein n=1 Tax=Saccharopolyspora hirsuta TaxID=1837 RepID=A0A5M7BMU9_SACHI|nr:acyl carrier protein [Saccharopolyspora hirsuta]KAA5830643.1 acyl carrier protein [Saccharopolyspora hirsuta]